MHVFSLPLTLLILVGHANAFSISLYSGEKCSGRSEANMVTGPAGCQTQGAGTAAAAVIKSTGAVDDTFYTAFYSSDDCNPDTLIAKSDDGCTAANYKSFEVLNVCEEGKFDCLD